MRRLTQHLLRSGAVCLVLAAVVFAVFLEQRQLSALGGAAAAAFGALGAAMQLWAHRYGTGHAAKRPVAEVLDRLAMASRTSRRRELSGRRANDPGPLPVAWQPAPELAEDWDLLEETARDWTGATPENWGTGPECLAGADGELRRVLGRIPTGRLAIAGRPGAGKTVLLARLQLDLIDRRKQEDPVPVCLPMASWDPAGQDYAGWIAGELIRLQPPLRDVSPDGAQTWAEYLVDQRLILPLLDGLDELPAAAQRLAIDKINAALHPGDRLVISCRTSDFRKATGPHPGGALKVRGAAAVALQELDPLAIRAHVSRDVGAAAGPLARWQKVLDAIGAGEPRLPVAGVLTRPLMLSLACAIYNPHPGEPDSSLPDPAELCDPVRFRCEEDIRRYLFEAYLPAAYRPRPGGTSPWTAQQAWRYLSYLAARQDSAGIWLWELVSRTAWPTSGLNYSLEGVSPVTAVAAAAISGGLGLLAGLNVSAHAGIGAGLGCVLAFALGAGIRPALTSKETGWSPRTVRARDRGTFLALTFLAGPLAGLMIALMTGELGTGLVAGLAVGLLYATGMAPWGMLTVARAWLAMRRRLPWRLLTFLEDAHQRDILRRVGAVYYFRHEKLRGALAAGPRSRS